SRQSLIPNQITAQSATHHAAAPHTSPFGESRILLSRLIGFCEVFRDHCIGLTDCASVVSGSGQHRIGYICPHALTFRIVGFLGVAFGIFCGPRHFGLTIYLSANLDVSGFDEPNFWAATPSHAASRSLIVLWA